MKEKVSQVNITSLKKILGPAFRAKVPVLIIGHKGIGKSEAVKQYCAENSLGFIDIRLAYLESQDIVGFPYRDDKTGRMSFSLPDWLPTDGKGILFLDEINRARIDVLQAVFQLVRDREIGAVHINGKSYRLPDGWSIVSAMNPDTPSSQYYVTPMDESLYDRFLKVAVISDFSAFRSYAVKSSDFHPDIKSFLSDESISLSDDPLPPVEVDATPRGFELFSRIYSCVEESEKDIVSLIGEGLIGPANTEKFISYLRNFYREVQELLERILNEWGAAPDLHQLIAGYQSSRNDIITALRDRFVIHFISDREKYALIKKDGRLSRFISYLFTLREEMIVSCLFSIREGFGDARQGQYLTDIIRTIESDEQSHKKYTSITEGRAKLKMAEYI